MLEYRFKWYNVSEELDFWNVSYNGLGVDCNILHLFHSLYIAMRAKINVKKLILTIIQ